jgi:hypothetical protein
MPGLGEFLSSEAACMKADSRPPNKSATELQSRNGQHVSMHMKLIMIGALWQGYIGRTPDKFMRVSVLSIGAECQPQCCQHVSLWQCRFPRKLLDVGFGNLLQSLCQVACMGDQVKLELCFTVTPQGIRALASWNEVH